jgi:hypothetical protein
VSEKKVYLFRYSYSAGSTYRCFLTDSVEKVLDRFPEFTLADWNDYHSPADIKATLIKQAFDIDRDPALDPMLKHLKKAREDERRYQEKKGKGLI